MSDAVNLNGARLVEWSELQKAADNDLLQQLTLGNDDAFASDGFTEDGAEVLFVFGVGVVTDSLARIEVPVLVDCMPSASEQYRRGWWNGMDPDVGCQVTGGKEREPAGD